MEKIRIFLGICLVALFFIGCGKTTNLEEDNKNEEIISDIGRIDRNIYGKSNPYVIYTFFVEKDGYITEIKRELCDYCGKFEGIKIIQDVPENRKPWVKTKLVKTNYNGESVFYMEIHVRSLNDIR